jgi:hypothetical protein
MVGLVCAGRWLEIGGLAAVVVGSLAVYALMKRF